MRLNYKKGTLVGLALLVAGLGLVGLLISLTPFEGRRGLIRLVVSIFGPGGAQAFVAAFSSLMIFGGLRLVWLTFDGALAAEVTARGIRVRSIYYTGLLPWAAVGTVETRVVAGWGNNPLLVIYRTDSPGFLLRLAGLGDKVAVQRKFLNVDDGDLEEWIRAAQNRGTPLPVGKVAQPIGSTRRVFGRRQ